MVNVKDGGRGCPFVLPTPRAPEGAPSWRPESPPVERRQAWHAPFPGLAYKLSHGQLATLISRLPLDMPKCGNLEAVCSRAEDGQCLTHPLKKTIQDIT